MESLREKNLEVHIIGAREVGKIALMRELLAANHKDAILVIDSEPEKNTAAKTLNEHIEKDSRINYVKRYEGEAESLQSCLIKESKPPKARLGGNNRKQKGKRKKAKNGRSNKKRK